MAYNNGGSPRSRPLAHWARPRAKSEAVPEQGRLERQCPGARGSASASVCAPAAASVASPGSVLLGAKSEETRACATAPEKVSCSWPGKVGCRRSCLRLLKSSRDACPWASAPSRSMGMTARWPGARTPPRLRSSRGHQCRRLRRATHVRPEPLDGQTLASRRERRWRTRASCGAGGYVRNARRSRFARLAACLQGHRCRRRFRWGRHDRKRMSAAHHCIDSHAVALPAGSAGGRVSHCKARRGA